MGRGVCRLDFVPGWEVTDSTAGEMLYTLAARDWLPSVGARGGSGIPTNTSLPYRRSDVFPAWVISLHDTFSTFATSSVHTAHGCLVGNAHLWIIFNRGKTF